MSAPTMMASGQTKERLHESHQLAKPGGLDRLDIVDIEAPGALAPGDILVRIHASSLNFHDFAVVSGWIPTRDGRIRCPTAPAWSRRSAKG